MKKKNIIKPLLFSAGLVLILYLVSYLFLPYNSTEDGLYKKASGILSEPANSIDYVAIGDSECSTSISPMEIWNDYGYTGYNCGVPGQRIQETYYLLKQLLKKQSPKVVFLETNACFQDFSYVNALETDADETVKKIFPVYQYHNSWKYFHLYMLKNVHRDKLKKPVTVYKGYQYNTIVKSYDGGAYVTETSDIYDISQQPLLYLNKIAKLCKDNNIQLILYNAPSPKNWSYSKHNAIVAYAKENPLPYIDLNLSLNTLGIDWKKDSRDDGDHMNYYGAKKISRYLGSYLSDHENLSDHRQEKGYESWNLTLKGYEAITEHK